VPFGASAHDGHSAQGWKQAYQVVCGVWAWGWQEANPKQQKKQSEQQQKIKGSPQTTLAKMDSGAAVSVVGRMPLEDKVAHDRLTAPSLRSHASLLVLQPGSPRTLTQQSSSASRSSFALRQL